MATTYFRHQLHLYRHQVAGGLVLAGLLLSGTTQAQSPTRASRSRSGAVKSITTNNLPNYDDRWFHGGFQLNVSATRFRIEHSAEYPQKRAVTANAIISPSFGVNFIADARLADLFTLRFTPGIQLATRRIEYKALAFSPADSIQTQEVGGTLLDFPLLVKFHSERRRNSRLYLIAGAKATVGVTNRRQNPETSVLRTSNTDFSLEYGVGMDLFYPFFKFAPELRFSQGLPNVLEPGNDVYSRNLRRLRTGAVTLYLNFE